MIKKILIIKPSGIGDIVHSLPVAIALKNLYPNCEVHWLVFDKFSDILDGFSFIDKIIIWEYSGGIGGYLRLVKELRRENYSLIIDLQVLMRTSLLGYLINKGKIISTSFVREFSHIFVNPVTKFDKTLHAAERNYQVVQYLANRENKSLPGLFEILPWIKIDASRLETYKKTFGFDTKKKYIGVSIGSRGQHKIWPTKNFVELIKLLNKNYNNIFFIFIGSNEEKKYFEKVSKDIDSEYLDLFGKISLKDIPYILSICSLTISNDNGIAHISAALDKPTLVLFGPSNPIWFYPYNKNSGFLYKKLKCSPCGIKTSCKNNICMKQITPKEVYDYIKEKFNEHLK
ncbi:MAG: lipopolysaccharide heptosyltransferase II [Endomicrobia bacterium]|nr:lipopolysaccharide heptosyltransferase II [Endomicrobiia bacterium]